jgi:hypothetical protein
MHNLTHINKIMTHIFPTKNIPTLIKKAIKPHSITKNNNN